MANFFTNLVGVFRKKPKPTETVGTAGAVVFNGYVSDGEKSSVLVGKQKYITYSEMLANISIVAAGTRYFLNLIAKASLKVVPANDSPEALEFAEKTEKIIADMNTSMARMVRRAAMFRFYGFSLQEWTAVARDDGMIGIKDVAPRPQSTIEQWDLDEKSEEVLGVTQRSPNTSETFYLPRGKLIYLVDDTINDSPEGLGLFRHIYKASTELEKLEELEGIGYETDLRGIPVGYAPQTRLHQMVKAGTIDEEFAKGLIQGVKDFIKERNRTPSTGLLLDSEPFRSRDEGSTPSSVRQWMVELLKSGSSNQAEVNKAINRKTHEIARVLNMEGLLLGGGERGSFALSKDKSNNLFLIVDSTAEEIGDAYTNDLIKPLWALNAWPEEHRPTLEPEPIRFQDVEQITSALGDMAKAGAPLAPNDPANNAVRDLLSLPHAPDEEVDSAVLARATDNLIEGLADEGLDEDVEGEEDNE